MVEQDLVISRALVDLFNNDTIKNNLIFRGGTALNKLYLKPPARYSEDLDFVQTRPEPIGSTIDAIRTVLSPWLGEPKPKQTERGVKLVYRYPSIDNIPVRLKIEINTTEHFSVFDLQHIEHTVDSEWFTVNDFRIDMYMLLPIKMQWNFDTAFDVVQRQVIDRIRSRQNASEQRRIRWIT